MSHGIMGVGPTGFIYMGGFIAFFAYLSRSFKGPEGPKFVLDKDLVDAVRPYQPGLAVEHYYKENNKA